MKSGKQPPPPWVHHSRVRLAKIRNNARTVRREGNKEIQRGLEKLRAADRIEGDVSFLEGVLGQDHRPDEWADEVIQGSGALIVPAIIRLDDQVSRLARAASELGAQGEFIRPEFVRAVVSSDSSSASAVYVAAAVERRFIHISGQTQESLTPLPNRFRNRDEVLIGLRAALAGMDPSFQSMLEGSENALSADQPDHLAQAAHSMRDLFQQLIEHLAPAPAVKAQSWFRPTEGAPAGVSRRSRIRYILQGPAQVTDDELTGQLDEAADQAKTMLDLCIGRAHDHDPSLTLGDGQLAIDQARYALLGILNARTTDAGAEPPG